MQGGMYVISNVILVTKKDEVSILTKIKQQNNNNTSVQSDILTKN